MRIKWSRSGICTRVWATAEPQGAQGSLRSRTMPGRTLGGGNSGFAVSDGALDGTTWERLSNGLGRLRGALDAEGNGSLGLSWSPVCGSEAGPAPVGCVG